jgi:hypothetical protein
MTKGLPAIRKPFHRPGPLPMHLIAIGWIYVVLMMAVAEALSSQGSVIGAVFTFLLYGVLPLAIVLYIVATPARKKALRLAEQREAAHVAAAAPVADPPAGSAAVAEATLASPASPASPADLPYPPSAPPDRGGHAAGAALAPERKEP